MKRLLIALSMFFSMLGTALADNGLVTRESRHSVAETMDRLEAAVKQSGSATMRIFARIDYQALAGGKIRPNQALIFGGGGALPALAGPNPPVAMDLPLKVLVWEDSAGRTWVSYNSPAYLRKRHAIADGDEAIELIRRAHSSYVDKATQ